MAYIYAQPGQPLSNQERKVLLAAASGLTVNETAEALLIGRQSVLTYRRGVLAKLGARSMAHAVAVWMQKEAA